MENWLVLLIPIILGTVFITGLVIFLVYMSKIAKKKMHLTSYFGLKSAKIDFKSFDTSTMHSLFVFPKREYEVVYRLETSEGTVSIKLDERLKIETDSRKEGSEVMTFNRFKPIISFRGHQAKNGKCSIKLYKKRH